MAPLSEYEAERLEEFADDARRDMELDADYSFLYADEEHPVGCDCERCVEDRELF